MYTSPTRALAELISNAWDANAETVTITMPLDQSFSESSVIVVEDAGDGMSFEDCKNEYLIVGRDRRKEEGEFTKGTGSTRRIQGHKGLGKLAGFGIANLVEVRTVKNGWLTHFAMDYDKIERTKIASDCELDIIEDRKTDEKNGTKIILKRIKLQRAIPKTQFIASMGRRFSIFSDDFKVSINGEPLTKNEMQLEFRFPTEPGTWNTEDIDGCGNIKWWIGFTKDPIEDEGFQGVSVLSRGKIAQEPWFFGLTGGLWAQHGKEYLTGEVIVDQIDSTEDLISTDRATSRWTHPMLVPVQVWGQKKIRDLLKEWATLRSQKKIGKLKERIKFADIIEKYQPSEQAEIKYVFDKLASSATLGDDKIYDIAVSFLKSFQNEHVMSLIRKLDMVAPDAQQEIWSIIGEYDIFEAIDTYQKVKNRRDIITKLEEMIAQGVPERPDMQAFMEKHVWLIDPRFEYMRPETNLDNLLAEEFKLPRTETPQGRKIPDLFCLAGLNTIVVIELKRPGRPVPKAELDKARDYVFFLGEWARKSNEPQFKNAQVSGTVILSDFAGDVTPSHRDSYEKSGLYTREWRKLHMVAKESLDILLGNVKTVVPKDDPRVKAVENPDYLKEMLQGDRHQGDKGADNGKG